MFSTHSGARSRSACPAAPGVSADQIKLGMIYPNSGGAANLFAPFRAGVDARFGVENAAGGVNGRRLTYGWADDRTDLNGNLAAAQNLVDQQKVFGLLEESTVASGSAPWLNQAGVPVVGTSVELVWTRYRNMFSYSNFITSGPSITTWGAFMKQHGVTKADVLYTSTNEASVTFRDKFVTTLKAAGIFGQTIEADPNSVDYPAVARQVKDSGADGLIGATDPTMFVTASAYAAPSLKLMLAPSGYDQQVISKAGRALAGKFTVFLPSRTFEEPNAATARFLQGMAVYSPQLQPGASELALEGWMSADMLVDGLRRTGECVTRKSFMTALRGIKNFDAGGLLPQPVDLDANFGKQATCYTFTQITADGKGWRPFNPPRVCGQLINAPTP